MGVLADFDAVAVLCDGRVIGNLLCTLLGRAAEEAAGGVDVSGDVNGAGGAGSDVDVACAGTDVERGWTVDVEGSVESGFGGEERAGHERQGEDGGGDAKIHRVSSEGMWRNQGTRYGHLRF